MYKTKQTTHFAHQNESPESVFQMMHEQLQYTLYNPTEIKNHGAMPKDHHKVQVRKLFIDRSESGGVYSTRAVKMPASRFSSNYGDEFGPTEIASGIYTFVILTKSPDVIYCGKLEDLMGHFSLSRGHNVCYAGEISFSPNGHMNYWTNDSGHYTPPEDLHKVNIHPYLRELLPSRLFKNYGG
ncbi:hypothetical protein [Yokenella regensburgei]|uniref:hypothetical protein n=1 Tax=Yokenella regensburgei TaxID=158877 RepID=UPI003EDA057C